MEVVSLFSGAGGMDLGFIRAGNSVVWANDNFKDAVETYKLNLGDTIILGDIRAIPSKSIPKCDMVIGGFPCQGFSIANWKRKLVDTRNFLYQEMVRVIRDKQPRFFLAENVKGLASLGQGRALQAILRDFSGAGYKVHTTVLNAADYGVPQNRERLFLFGVRNDLKFEGLFPPPPTHGERNSMFDLNLRPKLSVGDALKGIPEPDDAPNMPNHTCSKYKLTFNGYLGHRALDPAKPSPTVTARGDERGGVVVLPHPNGRRRMTARELAIIQSFPEDFVFVGSRTSAYRQIANAVPPRLAESISRALVVKARES